MVENRDLIIDFSNGKLARLSSTCKLEQRVLDHLLILDPGQPAFQAADLDPQGGLQVAAVQIVEH